MRGAHALRKSLFAILERRADEISERMSDLIVGLYEDWLWLDDGMPPLKWSTHWDSFIPQLEDQRMAGKREKPEDIVTKLRQIEVLQGQGMTIADAAREIGVSEQTVYRWRKQYGGMSRDQLKRLKDLEKENQRLRRAVSDLTLDKQILSEAVRGNF